MRITIACVGRIRAGPNKALYDEYMRRLAWPVSLREVEEKRGGATLARKAREADLLRAAIPSGAVKVCLDEAGKQLTSEDFAAMLSRYMNGGQSGIAFVIGGADGLDASLTGEADRLLSLGAMTWPHLLVRGMLAEQLFRAQAILSGHPYHRR
jgi:23S rRNA (pseudouridine1915-N3)-methyltransferase